MRIALAQYSISRNVLVNTERAVELIDEAAHKAVDLIVFPELCVSPFFPQYPKREVSCFASAVDGEIVRKFQQACRRLQIAAIPNLYLNETGRFFDASLLIDQDGNIQGISKMVHIAQLSGFFEQDYYTPSDTGFCVYDTVFGSIGIVVCFDRHYPGSAEIPRFEYARFTPFQERPLLLIAGEGRSAHSFRFPEISLRYVLTRDPRRYPRSSALLNSTVSILRCLRAPVRGLQFRPCRAFDAWWYPTGKQNGS